MNMEGGRRVKMRIRIGESLLGLPSFCHASSRIDHNRETVWQTRGSAGRGDLLFPVVGARYSLLISRLIPNKTPRKLKVLTSVF
jgi:hypothetical protein